MCCTVPHSSCLWFLSQYRKINLPQDSEDSSTYFALVYTLIDLTSLYLTPEESTARALLYNYMQDVVPSCKGSQQHLIQLLTLRGKPELPHNQSSTLGTKQHSFSLNSQALYQVIEHLPEDCHQIQLLCRFSA